MSAIWKTLINHKKSGVFEISDSNIIPELMKIVTIEKNVKNFVLIKKQFDFPLVATVSELKSAMFPRIFLPQSIGRN